jgi:hypothetical protein
MLHYVTYPQAKETLGVLRQQCRAGAKLYLGVSGLASELAQGYAGTMAPAENRYCELDAFQQARHKISEPVCLYAPEELAALVRTCGFTISRVWLSAFGNVKLEGYAGGFNGRN